MDGGKNTLLESARVLKLVPLSYSTVHAAKEASWNENTSCLLKNCFAFPWDSSPSTGLYATLHNNQLIDMAPFELDKEPDMYSRSFKQGRARRSFDRFLRGW